MAIRLFSEGVADISENAGIIAETEEERFDWQKTIRAIYDLKRKRSPETVYWHLRKHLEENDVLKHIYNEADRILQHSDNLNGLHVHQLGKLLLQDHPDWESMDIERRIRELYEIGWLAKPRFGYYALQPERIRELKLTITA